MEFTELELKHQEAPDLQSEPNNTGQPWAPCLNQLLEASFTDLHGRNTSTEKELTLRFSILGCIHCIAYQFVIFDTQQLK